jgi:hypothetical protein
LFASQAHYELAPLDAKRSQKKRPKPIDDIFPIEKIKASYFG